MNRTNRMLIGLLALSMTAGAFAHGGASSKCAAPVMHPDSSARYSDIHSNVRFSRYVDMHDHQVVSMLNTRLDAQPHNESLLIARGSGYARDHDRSRALADFRGVLRRHPRDVNARWNYGWALLNLGDTACATTQWQEAAAIDGGHPAWLPSVMALAYWKMGQQQLAVQWYGAAAQTYPERWGKVASIMAMTSNAAWSDQQRNALKAIHTRWLHAQSVAMGR